MLRSQLNHFKGGLLPGEFKNLRKSIGQCLFQPLKELLVFDGRVFRRLFQIFFFKVFDKFFIEFIRLFLEKVTLGIWMQLNPILLLAFKN